MSGPCGVLSRLRTLLAEFSRRKQRTVALLRASNAASGGLWFVPTLSEGWHWTQGTRVVGRFGRTEGVHGSVVKRAAIGVLAGFAPPLIVWRPAGEHGRTGRHVMVTKDDGGLVFDRVAGQVTHHRASALPSEYRDRRDLLGTYYDTPAYALSPDRRVVREQLIPGRPLALADKEAKVDAAHRILAQNTRLVSEQNHDGDCAHLVRASFEHILAQPLGEALRAEVEGTRTRLMKRAPLWRTLISHGDLTPLNVLLGPGGRPIVIDLEDARVLPYFYDAASMLARDADLWAAARAGEFDQDVDEIRSAACDEDPLDLLDATRVVALIAAADHALRYGGDAVRTLGTLWPRAV